MRASSSLCVRLILTAHLALGLASVAHGAPQPSAWGKDFIVADEKAPAETYYWSPGSLARMLQLQPLEPIAPPRKYRSGPGTFRTLAPSVVVVRSWRGHGSGFVVDEKGLVLTNNHVVEGGAFVDSKGPSSYVEVDLGRLEPSGTMKRLTETVRGYIVDVDPERDLALLKLDHVPAGVSHLTAVPMAETDPAPGMECSMMGHPASGMLWTYSEGQVSALGKSPGDLVDFLLPLLRASSRDRAKIESSLDSVRSLTVVLSSCLANPGDSGGPLVDSEGRLIGVTFAVPGDVSKRVLTYHIALSEVKDFLAGASETPTLLVPDAWQLDPKIRLVQANVLLAEGPYSSEVLLDVDSDTPTELIEQENYPALIGRRQFNAEVAFHAFPDRRLAFYDTDNDSRMDTILIDNDPDENADQRFVLKDGKWRFDDKVDVPFVDPSLCGSLSVAFRGLAKNLGLLK